MIGNGKGTEVQDLGRREATHLIRRYHEYCRREANAFLHVVPRDGVRPLYAAAREWAKETGRHDPREPMAALVAYVIHRLPLPPFEAWLEDLELHPLEHAVSRSTRAAFEEQSGPTSVECRDLRHRSRAWHASLELFRDGPRWRGYIAFRAQRARHRESEAESFRTANIFVESDPDSIRDRFRGYHDETLRGFLRSVLP